MDLHPRSSGAQLHPGAVIAGRYQVDTRVGTGGMGAVWSGEHLAVGVKVALKQLLVAAAESHEVVARFRREAVFLGKIRSDHVARVLDFVTDERYGLVLVMEYIEGDPLSKILGARTLSVEETVDLGADISAALVDLHRHHIVHRDLKPGNIIWQTLPNGTHRAVIVDFGVSRILSQGVEEDEEMTGITRADMALGTIEYMAPEQILNSRDVTAASDIYALGAILYRAYAGRHVFGEVYDAELAKKKIWTDPTPFHTGRTDKLARGLEAVVNRTLTRSPKKRYAQSDQVLAELNMLRDLMKAASFDLDTMTTRDDSAVLAALAAHEAKEAKKEPPAASPAPPAAAAAFVQGPTSAREPVSVQPVSSSQSSVSFGAQTASIPADPPRVEKRGVSSAVAILGFLVALVGGTALGTRFAPRLGGLIPGLAAPAPETAAAAPMTALPAAPSSAPEASAAPSVTATAEPEPIVSAEPIASAPKPKVYGKLPENRPSAPAVASSPTKAPTAPPTVTASVTTAPTVAPAVKSTDAAATSPKPSPRLDKDFDN